jgi:Xaa-Pro aminopeptidase
MSDPILITNPTNIRYLTGFVGVSPNEREAYVLHTDTETFLFTNALYKEEAQKRNTTFVEISRENSISKELSRIISERAIKVLAFEDTDLTVAEHTKLQSIVNVPLVPVRNRIETQRMIKRKDELEHIRLAADLTDQCFRILLKAIRPGMTERKLALYIEGFFKSKGAENAFSPIVAYNEHSSQPHYLSSGNNPLRKGSLILLDFGAKANGYCSDMSRVVFLGTPKPEWVYAYETVLAANTKAIAMLKDGERHGATLDAAAKEIIAEADLPVYPHSLGHAVGLDVHEAPRLSTHADEVVRSGMVFTIEPGVYIEGAYGIRIEDLVRLHASGVEVLSHSPKTLIKI